MFDFDVILLNCRRKILDEYNDEEVEITKEEARLIHRVLAGKAPHADFDPYAVRINLSIHCLLIEYLVLNC